MIAEELKCLRILDELSEPNGEGCLHFITIQRHTGYDRARVRRHVRRLSRKGLAEYYRGLYTDEGKMAGAGYCITHKGQDERERIDG